MSKKVPEIKQKRSDPATEFNASLPTSDGGNNGAEHNAAETGRNEADDDIRAGRVKKFDNAADAIKSLKKPW